MIVVLGGGISGLCTAYHLKKAGKQVLLLEKDTEAGGKIKSFCENDLVGELGPNTVLLNNLEFKELLDDLDLSSKMIFADKENASKRYILYKGKVEAMPLGPLQLIKSPLIGFRSLKKLAKEFSSSESNNEKESLAELCRRHFGEEILENFIYPFVSGIYAGDPEKMDADHVLPILKKADRNYGSIIRGVFKSKKKPDGGLPKQKMFSFAKGLQTLPQALSDALGDSIVLGAEIQSIKKQADNYVIDYTHDDETKQIKADTLISSLPLPSLSRIENNFLSSELEKLGKIPYVPVAVIHLAFDRQSLDFKQKAFGLLSRKEEKQAFLGILFNSRFFPHTSKEGVELMTVICGGALQPEISELTDEELLKRVLESVKTCLGSSSKPIFSKITRWNEGIPQYNLGYDESLQALNDLELKNKNLYFTGNYRNGVSVSDCVKNASLLAKKLINQNN